MDQQSKHIKIDVNGCKLSTQMKRKQNLVCGNMSEEELKIRGELEIDIERNLEEEIKDEIYHLALRLHRLYQHKKEREALDSGGDNNKKSLSEVNISIRMEGGTKIEIKETKKEASEYKGHQQGRPWSSRSENVPVSKSNNKKFDWEKSLRSGSGADPTANIINKRNRRYNSIDNAAGSIRGVDNPNKEREAGWKW